LTNLAYQQPDRAMVMDKKLDAWVATLPATARYDPEKRGKNMISSLGGAPADVKPDPRYMIPYDNPVATPYPAAVVSPCGPAITPEPTIKSADKGTLSEAERKSLRSEHAAMSEAKGNPRDLTKLFQRRDQNKDGFVTLAEFIGDPKSRNVTANRRRWSSVSKTRLPPLFSRRI